MELVCVRSERG